MTVQDEARELLRQQRAAEDTLAALRQEVDELVADPFARIEPKVAEDYERRLAVARARVQEIRLAIQHLSD
jgi:hypothetical protein